MSKKVCWRLGGLASIALLLLFPILHVALVIGNLVIHLFILGLQLITARFPKTNPENRAAAGLEPFVSIHVPAHNEPPHVLRETLLALSFLHWKNYEVLVIDNNTTDETLWRPIEKVCKELGPRFRFIHVEELKGAKGGALNYVRDFMNPKAEFIFVVDADYIVERNALKRALRYVADSRTGLVQFPQEYRNVEPGNAGIALDFRHFFAGYMNMANRLGCVPSTGTLSLIRVEALRAVGGFDTNIVTEDAELGFRLNFAGWHSVFANEVIGRGLMPHDLESLKKQRWRWAFGNAQILKLNWRRLLFSRELSWRQKIGYLIHLTAWFNFNLIPSLSLILLTPAVWLNRMHPLQHYIVVISGFTLVTFMVLRFGTLFYSLRHDRCSLREIFLAFLTHLGLGWIFSTSWLKCIFDDREPFVRTNKFLSQKMPGVLRVTLVELLMGVALLTASVVLAASDFIIGPIAAFLMFMARFLVYWVWWQTRRTWDVTKRLAGPIIDDILETLPKCLGRLPPGASEISSDFH